MIFFYLLLINEISTIIIIKILNYSALYLTDRNRHTFASDIRMEFGLYKYKILSFKKGVLQSNSLKTDQGEIVDAMQKGEHI